MSRPNSAGERVTGERQALRGRQPARALGVCCDRYSDWSFEWAPIVPAAAAIVQRVKR